MTRRVEAELLDSMPVERPEAQASRRDLRRLNGLMGHLHLWPKLLKKVLPAERSGPWQVAELGVGDGWLTAEIWRRLPPPPPGSRLTLVDRQRTAAESAVAELTRQGWTVAIVVGDALEWLSGSAAAKEQVIYANLFLHHFADSALAELLQTIARRSRGFACLEPRRSARGLFGVGWLWILGCHAVTRHDARRSVHAGFRDQEITARWPSSGAWQLHENRAGLFSHQFTAKLTGAQ